MARRSDHTRPELRKMAIEAARRIIIKDGLKALSIRKISAAIGYTSGTLYQLFDNLDALITEVHIATLQGMFKTLEPLEMTGSSEASLMVLAQGYADYATENQNCWNALFEHARPSGAHGSEQYTDEVTKLISLAARALKPVLKDVPDADTVAMHEASVLWASFYGIISLDSVKKLSTTETSNSFIASLVRNYVAGLRQNYQGS